ncbi:PP2C family protein-serine/threonine phosphatase [Turneriella parva]|uniref:Protein serine/threonine phosphatase with GAF(S) sensor(S) n=1 Tax=Turneriella parva (strain ATCC BAA-1111 / DSM 21527 / NCTC 11395 / H) TaxID=869212 RepID=I4B1C3_TURPD|nr:GAF domain-containing SpoIIE family protein phosphatase [Turneriella parva]AFM11080.1 protein serine/threonine phosphatase with GAF(s) sensor(s) [Turneriella parva DSM 21527]
MATEVYEFITTANEAELQAELIRYVSLFQINEVLSSTLDYDEVLRLVLQEMRALSGAEIASIFLINKKDQVLEFAATTDAQAELLKNIRVPLGKGISGYVAQTGEYVNQSDIKTDSRYYKEVDVTRGGETKSYLCVPLKLRGEIKGTVQLMNKAGGHPFTDADVRLMLNFSTQAAMAIETSLLHRDALSKKAFERDVHLAADIQRQSLPHAMPQIEGYSIHGHTEPAQDVGGDYFQFINHVDRTGNTKIDLIVADVAGKGIPASLIVSNFHAALQLLSPLYDTLGELAFQLNNFMRQNLITGTFVTAFIARLDAASGRMHYVSCGHNPPYIFRKNEDNKITAELLQQSGTAFGLRFDMEYRVHRLDLKPGETVLIYSDGITEAMDPENVQYETDRMNACVEKVLARTSGKNSAEQVVNDLREDVDKFRRGAEVNDDLTVVCLQRL